MTAKYKMTPGITDKVRIRQRCDRCDLLLEHSNYKNKKLVYSVNRRSERGFLCVSCCLRTKVTIKDLDNYLANKLRLKI